MLIPTVLSIAVLVLWSAVGLCNPCHCKEPEVRREWRALSADEKADWIRAVKVRLDTSPSLAVILKHYYAVVLVTTAP